MNVILIFMILLISTNAFSRDITGVIIDEHGKPVPGASVSVAGNDEWAVSDAKGAFLLSSEPLSIESDPKGTTLKHNHISMKGNGVLQWSVDLGLEEISIISLKGQQLFKKELAPSVQSIKLPRFAQGIYILGIIRLGKVSYRKFGNTVSPTKQVLYSFENTTPLSHSAINSRSADRDSLTIKVQHDAYLSCVKAFPKESNNISITLLSDTSSIIFRDDTLLSYHISVSDSAMDWLNKNALLEEYVPAKFIFQGDTIGEVGLRYQGSTYSLGVSFNDTGKVVPKVSFKVKFNKYDKKLRFFSLKKLMFKTLRTDASKMRAQLSYALFNEMGVLTPRTTYCKLYINGKYEGVFQTTEQVDGRFTKRRFPQYGDGNLYKEVWPGASSSEKVKTGLKTNEEVADIRKWEEFSDALNSLDTVDFKNRITEWMDLDYMMRYMVVDRAVAQWDGIMTWYGENDSSMNHNYYWYEEEQPGGKFWIVAWDYDIAFFATDPLFETAQVPYWNSSKESRGVYTFIGGSKVTSPHSDDMIYNLGQTCWDDFVEVGKAFLNDGFRLDSLTNKIDRWAQLIDDATKEDPNSIVTYDQWKSAVEQLKKDLKIVRQKFTMRLDGSDTLELPEVDQSTIAEYNGLKTDRDNTFELQDSADIKNRIFSSTSGKISTSLEQKNPLSGKSSLRADLTLTEIEGQWNEYAQTNIQFTNETEDLSDFDLIAITLRSSDSREVRISLNSEAYPNPYGSLYGITVVSAPEAKTYQLRLPFFLYESWGAQTDVKEEVLRTCNSLGISITPKYNPHGNLAADEDSVTLWIDDIRFIRE